MARGRHGLLTTLRCARSKVTFRTSSISSFHFAASLLNFIPGNQLGRCRTENENFSVCVALEKPEEKWLLTGWDKINEITLDGFYRHLHDV